MVNWDLSLIQGFEFVSFCYALSLDAVLYQRGGTQGDKKVWLLYDQCRY